MIPTVGCFDDSLVVDVEDLDVDGNDITDRNAWEER